MIVASIPPVIDSPAPAAPVSERGMLSTRMETIAKDAQARYGATLGVVIWDLETDVLVERDSQRAFPMGNASRLAIALAIFDRIDRGSIDYYDVQPQLARMLIDDDRSASDALYALAGGSDGINASLRAANVTAVLIRTDASGVAADVAVGRSFAQGGDNAGSPSALALLLSEVARGDVLTPASHHRFVDLLARSTQLPQGFRAGLMPGTRLAHASGISTGAACDAGIAEINGRAVVIVGMLSGANATEDQRAAVLAAVARAAFDATARVLP